MHYVFQKLHYLSRCGGLRIYKVAYLILKHLEEHDKKDQEMQ